MAAHKSLKVHVFADERSTGFTALGIAKTKPDTCNVAVVTTSGTALANLFPAIVEASESETSMLIITADRPPELRHSRANQAIDQVNIFGKYVNFCIDFPVPEASRFSSMLSQMDHLIFRSQQPVKGPVHANLMFREPMGTEKDLCSLENLPKKLINWQNQSTPYTEILYKKASDLLIEKIKATKRGLVVVGSLPIDKQMYFEHFLRKLNWPVIADSASGLTYRNIETLVWMSDILTMEKPDSFCPDTIIRVGHTFSNKWIDKKLLNGAKTVISLDWSYTRPDPESFCDYVLIGDKFDDIAQNSSTNTSWNNMFHKHNSEIKANLKLLNSTEMELVLRLPEVLPENGLLFIGNSMPIRDFSSCGIANRPDITVLSNRGASGIDGLISTAAGTALATKKPCTIVLGDLSAIHDLASLLYLKNLPLSLNVIIINNSGGGIFHELPLAKSPHFSPTFDAPHEHALARITASFSISSHVINKPEQLKTLPNNENGVVVIELVVNKEADLEMRAKWRMLVREIINSVWGG
jgi:2-succinyl-5-enolpyruvyl-6-hydroxy-3-cyclohexene-1-carboxylate synthase